MRRCLALGLLIGSLFIGLGVSQGRASTSSDGLAQATASIVKRMKDLLPRSAIEALGDDDPLRQLFAAAAQFERLKEPPFAQGEALVQLQNLEKQAANAIDRIRKTAQYVKGHRPRRWHYTQSTQILGLLEELNAAFGQELQRQFALIKPRSSVEVGFYKGEKAPQELVPSAVEISPEKKAGLSKRGEVASSFLSKEEQEHRKWIPKFRVEKTNGLFFRSSFLRLPSQEDVDSGRVFFPLGDVATHTIERFPDDSLSSELVALPVLDKTKPERVEFRDASDRLLEVRGRFVRFESGTYAYLPDRPLQDPHLIRTKVFLSRDPLPIPKPQRMTSKAREFLFTAAKERGFSGLAAQLLRLSDGRALPKDVTGLSVAVREATTYSYKRLVVGKKNAKDPLWKRFEKLQEKPSGFHNLRVQCTQAAGIVDEGITAAFPKLESWIESGYVVSPGGNVSSADAHARVVVQQKDGLLFLDPTPPERDLVISGRRGHKFFDADLVRLANEKPPPAQGVADFVARLEKNDNFLRDSRRYAFAEAQTLLKPIHDQITKQAEVIASHYQIDLHPEIYLGRLYDEVFGSEKERLVLPWEAEPLAQNLAEKRGVDLERARNMVLDERVPRLEGLYSGSTVRSQPTRRLKPGTPIDPEVGARYYDQAWRYLTTQRMRTLRAALEMPGIPKTIALEFQNMSQYIPEDHFFRSTSKDFRGFTEGYLFHFGDHDSPSWIRAVRDRESYGSSNALQACVRDIAAEALWSHFKLVQDLLDQSFQRMDDPTDTLLRNSIEQTQQLFQIVTGPREGIVVPGDYRPVYTDQRGKKVILSYLPKRLTTVAPLRPELSDVAVWALLPDASLKRLAERDAIAEKLGKPDVEIVLREWAAQRRGPWMGLGAKWSPSVGCEGQSLKDALMQELKEGLE